MMAMHSPFVAALRLAGFLLWTLAVVPPYAALLGCRRVATCQTIAVAYWRVVVRLIGLAVVVHGTPSRERPTLFVANHASYLDIVILGSLLRTSFVAKKEVSQWPGFGTIAKLGRTVFVDRRPRRSMDQRDEMRMRMADMADSLVLFPEGTSSDGNRVLPFKSALFSVAERALPEGQNLPIQPISIAYTRLDGMPMGRGWRPFFTWFGDMELAPHLWVALGLGRTTVEVDFHPVVRLDQFSSRKDLANHCHDVVRNGVISANLGRPRTPTGPAEGVAVG